VSRIYELGLPVCSSPSICQLAASASISGTLSKAQQSTAAGRLHATSAASPAGRSATAICQPSEQSTDCKARLQLTAQALLVAPSVVSNMHDPALSTDRVAIVRAWIECSGQSIRHPPLLDLGKRSQVTNAQYKVAQGVASPSPSISWSKRTRGDDLPLGCPASFSS
jgi:hypothetical protein